MLMTRPPAIVIWLEITYNLPVNIGNSTDIHIAVPNITYPAKIVSLQYILIKVVALKLTHHLDIYFNHKQKVGQLAY